MKKIYEWKYDDNHSVKMPMATIQGSQEGPIFTVTSGMHAGEYAGILAAQQLIQTINPEDGSLVSLYWGDETTNRNAEEVNSNLVTLFPMVDFEVVEGGQPYYNYLISVE